MSAESLTAGARMRWAVCLVLLAVVGSLAHLIAVQQFVVKFWTDMWAYTRTVPGIAFLALAFCGPLLPILLYRRRAWFLSLRRWRQWLATIGLPTGYLVALGLLLAAALLWFPTPIFARPHPTKAAIKYDPRERPARTEVRLHSGRNGTRQVGGGYRTRMRDGVERWAATDGPSNAAGGFSPFPGRPPTIAGRTERLPDGAVRMTLDVDTVDPLTFEFAGLAGVELLRGGRPHDPAEPRSGRYTLVVTGRAEP